MTLIIKEGRKCGHRINILFRMLGMLLLRNNCGQQTSIIRICKSTIQKHRSLNSEEFELCLESTSKCFLALTFHILTFLKMFSYMNKVQKMSVGNSNTWLVSSRKCASGTCISIESNAWFEVFINVDTSMLSEILSLTWPLYPANYKYLVYHVYP